MPTIAEVLASHLLGGSATAAGSTPIRSHPLVRAGISLLETIGGVFQVAAKAPPSPGYEPYLVSQGWNPLLARIRASLLVRHGTRVARDAASESKATKALRVLAAPTSGRLVRTRRAADLLLAWKETTLIETLFAEAGLDVFEFIRLLEQAADGHEHNRDRLTEFAAAVVRSKRGRRVSAASAAHEFILENLAPAGQKAYTYNDSTEDYTDPLTQATRREFGEADFDPRPAHRRVKARARSRIERR